MKNGSRFFMALPNLYHFVDLNKMVGHGPVARLATE